MANKKKMGFGLAAILIAAPMVALFEGTVLHTYIDPVGIPTACMGETDKEIVTLKRKFTAEECTALLGASLYEHMMEVAECAKVPVKPNEAAAIISWSYNIGPTAACKSTLMRKLNAGAPSSDWCLEVKKWIYAGGEILPGLVSRRDKEYNMCINGVWK